MAMDGGGAPGAAAKTVLGRAATAGAQGAGYAAMYGAGEGEGAEDRLKRAVVSAPLGFALGAGISPLAEGVVKLGQTQIAPRLRSLVAPDSEAGRRIGIAIDKDQQTATDTGASLPTRGLNDQEYADAQKSGLPVMNIDRGAATVRGLADAASIASPTARNILNQALNDRHVTQFQRFADTLDSMVQGRGSVATIDDLKDAASQANQAAYGIADTHPNAQTMWDQKFAQLMQSPAMQRAAKASLTTGAEDAAANGFTPIRHPFAVDPNSGGLVLRRNSDGSITAPNLSFWDATKKNLDDIIDKTKDPATGRYSFEGTRIINTKQQRRRIVYLSVIGCGVNR